jgi:Acyl dehydratase
VSAHRPAPAGESSEVQVRSTGGHWQLSDSPATWPAYARALLRGGRAPADMPQLPAMRVGLPVRAVDADHLQRYRALCGFTDDGCLPLTYPQVIAAPLHLWVLSRPTFPLPMLGLVHVGNRIETARPLAQDQPLWLEVTLGALREARRGWEFDLQTRAGASAAPATWQAVTTLLVPRRAAARQATAAAPAPEPELAQYLALSAPADIGRRYAAVSGDWNPIHLSAATARPFGFSHAIAHGMWTAARVLALLSDRLDGPPQRQELRFRRPLTLPQQAALRYRKIRSGIDFTVIGRAGRVCVQGSCG